MVVVARVCATIIFGFVGDPHKRACFLVVVALFFVIIIMDSSNEHTTYHTLHLYYYATSSAVNHQPGCERAFEESHVLCLRTEEESG